MYTCICLNKIFQMSFCLPLSASASKCILIFYWKSFSFDAGNVRTWHELPACHPNPGMYHNYIHNIKSSLCMCILMGTSIWNNFMCIPDLSVSFGFKPSVFTLFFSSSKYINIWLKKLICFQCLQILFFL